MGIQTIEETRVNTKKQKKKIDVPIHRSIIGDVNDHWEYDRKKKMREKREELRLKLRTNKTIEKKINSPLMSLRSERSLR